MSAIESAGSFTMPPLTGTLDGLWEVIFDLADNLPPMSWALVGGQMVMAHGIAAGRTPTRASQDIDVLGMRGPDFTAAGTVEPTTVRGRVLGMTSAQAPPTGATGSPPM